MACHPPSPWSQPLWHRPNTHHSAPSSAPGQSTRMCWALSDLSAPPPSWARRAHVQMIIVLALSLPSLFVDSFQVRHSCSRAPQVFLSGNSATLVGFRLGFVHEAPRHLVEVSQKLTMSSDRTFVSDARTVREKKQLSVQRRKSGCACLLRSVGVHAASHTGDIVPDSRSMNGSPGGCPQTLCSSENQSLLSYS